MLAMEPVADEFPLLSVQGAAQRADVVARDSLGARHDIRRALFEVVEGNRGAKGASLNDGKGVNVNANGLSPG